MTSFGNRIRISALVLEEEAGIKWTGETVIVGGWVKTIRVQGGGQFAFVEINDGSCVKHIQVVVDSCIENFSTVKEQGIGCCILVTGKVATSKGKKQAVTQISNFVCR